MGQLMLFKGRVSLPFFPSSPLHNFYLPGRSQGRLSCPVEGCPSAPFSDHQLLSPVLGAEVQLLYEQLKWRAKQVLLPGDLFDGMVVYCHGLLKKTRSGTKAVDINLARSGMQVKARDVSRLAVEG